MRRSLVCAALLLGVLASPAHAKGPTSFTISGPGLDEPLRAAALAQRNPTSYWRLVEQLGFFVTSWDSSTTARLAQAPSGPLGPKYRIRWFVPIPSNPLLIRQDLYPYASGGPVTYMPSGQELFDRKTAGGWYRAGSQLKAALVARGLPAAAPVRADRASGRERWPAGLAAAGIGAAGAAAFLVLRRRRTRDSG